MKIYLCCLTYLFLTLILFIAEADGNVEYSDPKPPNFIIILVDDLGYGDLSSYGSDNIDTPHLDQMATNGIRFTNFYAASPICTPTRAALLTGSYPQRVGLPSVLFPNTMPRGQKDGQAIGLNPNEITIAELLKQQGYSTALFGKWHLGDHPMFMPNNQGFDEYFGIPYSNDMMPQNPRRTFPPLPLLHNQDTVAVNTNQDLFTKQFTSKTIDFIERNKDRLFFIYLSHPMPHRPIHASEEFLDRFTSEQLAKIKGEDKASRDFLYPASVEELDWSVGQILKKIKEVGLNEETMIVFTSDNGPIVGSSGPLRGGKGSLYEGGVRVPGIIQWKGTIPEGVERNDITTIMDLYPTFAALSGAEVPDRYVIDGKNIWPILQNKSLDKPIHEAFYYFNHQQKRVWAIRKGPWKLFLWSDELYNLESDISEEKNLFDKHPKIVENLSVKAREFERQLETNSRAPGLVQ